MADNTVEKLSIELQADLEKLTRGVKQGVKESEEELKKLDKTSSKLETQFQKVGQIGKRAFEVLKVAITGALAALGLLSAALITVGRAAEEGISGIRIQRAFRQLAANVSQSADEILSSMRKASAGTIRDIELMTAAVAALNGRVATTPEQFEKLVSAAVKLGRARGVSPTEALERLVGGITRREVELLDELGLTLPSINAELEKIAQRDFGKAATGLTAVQRETAFAEAAINAAVASADRLGGSLDDVGTSAEQAQARIQNLKEDFNEASVVAVSELSKIGAEIYRIFFGPEGMFPLFETATNVIAELFAQLIARFVATGATIAHRVKDIQGLIAGELSLEEFFDTQRMADRFNSDVAKVLDKVKSRYPEIFDPESVAAPPPIPLPPTDEIQEQADETIDILLAAESELTKLQEDIAQRREKLIEDHNEKIIQIEQEAVEKRLELGQQLKEELAALDQETTDRRQEILNNAREELAKLSQDTDKELEEEREDFEREELRETEDHLKAMRRLRDQYLFDLEDAVKARDARAIVDLQRRFRQEKTERETDFQDKQNREREDQDLRLQQIREEERLRADEIIRAREQELAELAINEEKKRQQLLTDYAKELEQLRQNEQEKLTAENESYTERQTELDTAMAKRLEELAKRFAEEKDLTEEGAQNILETLSEFFGQDGEIDKLMEAYRNRLKTRMDIQVKFSGIEQEPQTGAPGQSALGSGNQVVPQRSFAAGGMMFANTPTVVEFGEAGPEIASFIPLNQMNQNMSSRETTHRIEFSGSAPPGLRSSERDQVAGVVVQALLDAGIRVKR